MARKLPYTEPRIWNPVFFSRHGIKVFVGGDGRELVYNQGSALRVRLEESLDPGTEIEIESADRGFNFYIKSERDAEREVRRQAYEERRLAEQLAEKERRQARNAEIREFNEALNIPVEWRPAHKIVLSGLLAGSSGTGENKRTVNHIELLGDLEAGRLKRKGGDLLCTPDRGSFDVSSAKEGDAWKVTCKRCLEISQRFQPDPDNSPKSSR